MLSIEEHIDLFPYNTFHLRCTARYLISLQSTRALQELIRSDLFKHFPHLILGGGSNILLRHNTFDGLVLKNKITGIEVVHEDRDSVTLKVGAGENWHAFVMHCVSQDWGGLENLSLIPGTVGAAPMQNIGAYGVEVKDVIQSVEAITLDGGRVRVFTNEECAFGYRESIFKHQAKGQYFISSVTFRLTKRQHVLNTGYGAIADTLAAQGVTTPTIRDVSDAVVAIRRNKLPDPATIGNAGSFFKNPSVETSIYETLKAQYPALPSYPGANGMAKLPAAWFIEQCGWKGKRIDDIGVHNNQALVLVNYGAGSGDTIWRLAQDIRESVYKKFGIELTPEVNLIE